MILMQWDFTVLLHFSPDGDECNLTSGRCPRWTETFHREFRKSSRNTVRFVNSRVDTENNNSRHTYYSFHRFCRRLFLQMPPIYQTILAYCLRTLWHVCLISLSYNVIHVHFVCAIEPSLGHNLLGQAIGWTGIVTQMICFDNQIR